MNFANSFPMVAGCGLVALLLLVGHWFPWQRWLGREMHRLEGYVYGTGSIWLAFLLTGWLYEMLWPVAWLSAIIVAGGTTTFASWGVDWLGLKLAENRRRKRSAEQNGLAKQ